MESQSPVLVLSPNFQFLPDFLETQWLSLQDVFSWSEVLFPIAQEGMSIYIAALNLELVPEIEGYQVVPVQIEDCDFAQGLWKVLSASILEKASLTSEEQTAGVAPPMKDQEAVIQDELLAAEPDPSFGELGLIDLEQTGDLSSHQAQNKQSENENKELCNFRSQLNQAYESATTASQFAEIQSSFKATDSADNTESNISLDEKESEEDEKATVSSIKTGGVANKFATSTDSAVSDSGVSSFTSISSTSLAQVEDKTAAFYKPMLSLFEETYTHFFTTYKTVGTCFFFKGQKGRYHICAAAGLEEGGAMKGVLPQKSFKVKLSQPMGVLIKYVLKYKQIYHASWSLLKKFSWGRAFYDEFSSCFPKDFAVDDGSFITIFPFLDKSGVVYAMINLSSEEVSSEVLQDLQAHMDKVDTMTLPKLTSAS